MPSSLSCANPAWSNPSWRRGLSNYGPRSWAIPLPASRAPWKSKTACSSSISPAPRSKPNSSTAASNWLPNSTMPQEPKSYETSASSADIFQIAICRKNKQYYSNMLFVLTSCFCRDILETLSRPYRDLTSAKTKYGKITK